MYDIPAQRRNRIGIIYMRLTALLLSLLKGDARAPTRAGGSLLISERGGIPWTASHRHKKGNLYRVLAPAILESDRSEVVIYDDEEGTIWVRSKAEFYDGRFREL